MHTYILYYNNITSCKIFYKNDGRSGVVILKMFFSRKYYFIVSIICVSDTDGYRDIQIDRDREKNVNIQTVIVI